MKFIISIIGVSTGLILSVFGQDREEVLQMWDDPQPYLNEILGGIRDKNSGSENDQVLSDRIRGLAYAINQEIISAESENWGKPSPARLKIINKWAVILEPHIEELLSLAMNSGKSRERSSIQARSILDFAGPTRDFERHVRLYFTESNNETVSAAAYLLYKHRLLTNPDIDILRANIQSINNYESKRYALLGLSFYGATDGIPVAQEILRSAPESDTDQDNIAQYRGALELIQNLGPAAVSLLPDLDELILKISKSHINGSKSGILIKLHFARDLITGNQPMQERFAANGSGPLALTIANSSQLDSQDELPSKDSSDMSPEADSQSVSSKSHDVIADKFGLISCEVIAILTGLLTIVVIVWLKIRKSKSI